MSLRDELRFTPGETVLAEVDARARPLAPGGKAATTKSFADQGDELAELQERLYAEGTQPGARRRVLVVLQSMDTSGKSGTIKHVAGEVDPQGLAITAFKAPTPEERRHNFLWRVRRRVPGPGRIGLFDRSHYEDVLIARVHGLAAPDVLERRYEEINRFEARLTGEDVTVVKLMLHISFEEQRARLLARLDDPAKHWKFNPGDLDERRSWDAYMEAYQVALDRCSTDVAPWYVVPADRKWYRNWAVAVILLETLRELDPQYPRPDLDVEALKARLLAAEDPVRS